MTFRHNLNRLAPFFTAKAIVFSGLLLAFLTGCASPEPVVGGSPTSNDAEGLEMATAVAPTPSERTEETTVPPTPTVPSAPTHAPPPPIPDDALPAPEQTPTPTPPESRALFLPQCDKRPLTDLPPHPHPETGETWVRYANEAYGFAFAFPPAWELVEGQNYVCLNYLPQPETTFVIGFKWFDDRQTAITRSGVAAGELTTDGTIQFLGREVERNVLRHDGKDKAILYDNAAPIRVNDLLFTLSLDDFSTPDETAELTPEIGQMADAIVASFALIDRLYINDTYGFSFVVPPEWRLRPAKFFDSPTDWQNALQLTYRPDRTNSAILTIAFKWEEEEDLRIVRTGTGPLDEIIEEEIEFMGQAIRRDVWRFEGKTQAVFYANACHINVNGLLFTLSLDYFDNRQLGGELSADAMASADAIAESFRLTWEDEWQTIYSDALDFAIDVPTGWRSHLDDGAAYFFSDNKFGAGPTPLTYYVYALEYPNPEQRPFPDVATSDLSLSAQENFSYSTEIIGDKTVYITEQMPSMGGALTAFFALDGRYLALALTPYDSQNPYLAQARHVALFETMLQTLEPLPRESPQSADVSCRGPECEPI